MKWCSVSQIWSKPSSSVHSICSSSRWTTSSWLSPGAAWKKKKVPKRMDRRSYTGSPMGAAELQNAVAHALDSSPLTLPSPPQGRGKSNPSPPEGRGQGEGELDLPQQAAVAGDALAHAGDPQRLPEARLVAANHRLAEIALQRLQHGHRGQPRSAQEHRVRLGRIRTACKLIR